MKGLKGPLVFWGNLGRPLRKHLSQNILEPCLSWKKISSDLTPKKYLRVSFSGDTLLSSFSRNIRTKLKTKVGAAGKKMKGLKGPLVFWGNLGRPLRKHRSQNILEPCLSWKKISSDIAPKNICVSVFRRPLTLFLFQKHQNEA